MPCEFPGSMALSTTVEPWQPMPQFIRMPQFENGDYPIAFPPGQWSTLGMFAETRPGKDQAVRHRKNQSGYRQNCRNCCRISSADANRFSGDLSSAR